jgi:predicted TIM-barrel fold metal-dependent hydrolase
MMIPIVDAHLHFFDYSKFDYPWTADPAWEFLRHRGYTPDDWRKDAAEFQVLAGVHVEAEIGRQFDPVSETAWLDSRPDVFAPLVYVGFADLRNADLDAVLGRQCEFKAMRGIRQTELPGEDLLSDDVFVAGLHRLIEYNLSFDLHVLPNQLARAADVFATVPELSVIIEHTALPGVSNSDGLAEWREGMRKMASQVPNSVVKISGMALYAPKWTVDVIQPVVREAIEIFSPPRCMLGSDYPVDGCAASYAAIWTAFDAMTNDLCNADRASIFYETALRVYRIDVAAHGERLKTILSCRGRDPLL